MSFHRIEKLMVLRIGHEHIDGIRQSNGFISVNQYPKEIKVLDGEVGCVMNEYIEGRIVLGKNQGREDAV